MPDIQMERFFLNALTPTSRRLAGPEPGAWKGDENSLDFLSKYASDIRIEGDLEDASIIHSVPSVFARPILFNQALMESANPLHGAFVAQWRGLLAVFALRKLFGFDVTVRPYKVIQDDSTRTNNQRKESESDLHAATVLRNQLPRPLEDWNRWYLIHCDRKLVGATSPWTIVFSPAEYHCPEGIPWRSQDGLLMDPGSYLAAKSSHFELGVLLLWVQLLLEEFEKSKWGAEDRLDDKMSTIKRELETWKKELTSYGVDAPKGSIGDSLVPERPYRYFLQACEVSGQDSRESELTLRTERATKTTLVFSRRGVDPTKRVYASIWGDQVDPSQLESPYGIAEWRARSGQKVPFPYVIAEDAFFTTKVLKLPLSERAIQPGTNAYALPLRTRFFDFFSTKDLIENPQMLRIVEQNDRVLVRLRLPLTSGSELVVERAYDRNNEVVEIKDQAYPAMALWPDFYDKDWLANFAAFSAPATGSEVLVAPLSDDGVELNRTSNRGDQSDVRIWSHQEPLVGFALYHRDSLTGEELPCGVVLRRSLDPPGDPDAKLEWNVGVDFGTSNTTLMVSEGSGKQRLLQLQPRTTLLTKPREEFLASLNARFYPSTEPVMSPFVTALGRSTATVFGEQMKFIPRFSFGVRDLDELVENLKWGRQGGVQDAEPMREYLRHMARLVACEARAKRVGSIKLEWSFPLALPLGVQRAMRTFWKTLDRPCKGEKLTIRPDEGMAESDAICRRLAWIEPSVLPVLADALSITIDVGGGSTDIGFWTKAAPQQSDGIIRAELIDQVSVKLAGSDIIDRRLCLDPALPRALWESCQKGLDWNKDLHELFLKNPDIALNKLLTDAVYTDGTPFRSGNPRRHPAVLGMQNPGQPPWSLVRSLAYLFYTGLTFYIGLHSRRLVQGKNGAVLYFGGRGSSLLNWITTDETDLRNCLLKAFQTGLAQDPPASVPNVEIHGPAFLYQQALPLKQEVAGGLLSPTVGNKRVEPAEVQRVIVGEAQMMRPDGQLWDFFTEVQAADIVNIRFPVSLDSSFIAIFVNRVLKENWRGLNLDEPNLGRLRPTTSEVQHIVGRSAQPDGVLQPIFFSALRAAMERYIRLATDAAARVAAG